MQYSVQFFTWTRQLGVHQVGKTVEIEALNPRTAAISLLGVRLEETGSTTKLAARVWQPASDSQSDCICFYYH